MYCGECGAKNKKDAEFCGECGAKLEHEKEEKNKKEEKKEDKKPMTKKNKIILLVVLILIVLLIIGYSFLNKKYSAEGVATDYLEALISNDADKIYDSLNIDSNNKFTSKETFKKMFEENYKTDIEVLNYTLTDIEYNDGNLSAEVEFKVIYKDSKEDSITINVVKDSKKKFLVFDSWYVSNGENALIVNDYTINVPKGAKVSVNDIELDNSYLNKDKSTDSKDVYVIDKIFRGTATIKTNIWGIETSKEVNVSSYNDNYTANIDTDTMPEETQNKIQEQVKTDINGIYKNIIDKKKWNDIRVSYVYNKVDLSNLEDEYNDLYEEVVEDDDKTLKKFDITDINISQLSIDEGRLKVRARVYFDYTIDYKNYKDEVKTTNSDSSAYITLVYDYFEENFKLYDVDNLVTYFSTR